MAQSPSKVIYLQTTGTSYLSISRKGPENSLVGDQALNFYADQCRGSIQNPMVQHVNQIGANVSGRKVSRRSIHRPGEFLFATKDSGKILKIAREKLGNERL